MRVIAVGRIRSGPIAKLFEDYAARLRPRLDLVELPDGRGSAAEIKRREGTAMLAALAPGEVAVALDLGGWAGGSEALAERLATWRQAGKLVFLLGGAEGLAATVLDRADHVLSLGPLTWPHGIARALLAEQLYRAACIEAHHPYHRAGRP